MLETLKRRIVGFVFDPLFDAGPVVFQRLGGLCHGWSLVGDRVGRQCTCGWSALQTLAVKEVFGGRSVAHDVCGAFAPSSSSYCCVLIHW